ncbi:MAG TPA: response regulator [Candidatus Omnitrophica bacterium]|nr:response regulator [Candidatus Omnitrophota bacterium]
MKRILIIEDESDICKLMEARLSAMGCEVIIDIANDGDVALQKIFESAPDLIFLDIMLPRVNGQEVLRLTKKNPKTANIPVIVITALPAGPVKDILIKLGAAEFLEKPVDSALLHQLVSAYLS